MTETPMQLPKAKNEVNVNTIITVVGFLLTIATGGAAWGTTQATISALVKDQIALTTRVAAAEASVGRMGNLEYRITVAEQSNTNLARAVEELRTAVANQSADIKVVREILSRIDQQMTRGQ